MKKRFGLYLIATDPVAGYRAVAEAAVDCGVRYLQLRMKDASKETLLETAYLLRDITHGTQTRFIVNDNLAAAMATDADGIHLGQGDMSLSKARKTWNIPGKIFGLSTHSMEQAVRAANLTPDYIGIGPVFPTQTKTDAGPALGPAETGHIAKQTPLASVAIGGINAGNLPDLLDAGIENFCVAAAVNTATDPAAAMRNLQKIWQTHVF